MEQGTLIYVEENDKSEARVLAQNFAKNDVKSRAYVNALGAELGMKYLSLENINNQRLYNMHSVRKVLEEFDISDIMLANIHIDVRVVFDENYIFVPKSHFEYDILPDIYFVMQLAADHSHATFLGFFEPKLINKNNQNDKYYFIEKEKLTAPSNLKAYIENFKGNTTQSLSDTENEKAEMLMVAMADQNISREETKELLKMLQRSADLRDEFIEFENFELLSYKAEHCPDVVVPVQNSTDEVLDTTLDDLTGGDELTKDLLMGENSSDISLDEDNFEDLLGGFEDENSDQNATVDEVSADTTKNPGDGLSVLSDVAGMAADAATIAGAGAAAAVAGSMAMGAVEGAAASVAGDVISSAATGAVDVLAEAAKNVANNLVENSESKVQGFENLEISEPEISEQNLSADDLMISEDNGISDVAETHSEMANMEDLTAQASVGNFDEVSLDDLMITEDEDHSSELSNIETLQEENARQKGLISDEALLENSLDFSNVTPVPQVEDETKLHEGLETVDLEGFDAIAPEVKLEEAPSQDESNVLDISEVNAEPNNLGDNISETVEFGTIDTVDNTCENAVNNQKSEPTANFDEFGTLEPLSDGNLFLEEPSQPETTKKGAPASPDEVDLSDFQSLDMESFDHVSLDSVKDTSIPDAPQETDLANDLLGGLDLGLDSIPDLDTSNLGLDENLTETNVETEKTETNSENLVAEAPAGEPEMLDISELDTVETTSSEEANQTQPTEENTVEELSEADIVDSPENSSADLDLVSQAVDMDVAKDTLLEESGLENLEDMTNIENTVETPEVTVESQNEEPVQNMENLSETSDEVPTEPTVAKEIPTEMTEISETTPQAAVEEEPTESTSPLEGSLDELESLDADNPDLSMLFNEADENAVANEVAENQEESFVPTLPHLPERSSTNRGKIIGAAVLVALLVSGAFFGLSLKNKNDATQNEIAQPLPENNETSQTPETAGQVDNTNIMANAPDIVDMPKNQAEPANVKKEQPKSVKPATKPVNPDGSIMSVKKLAWELPDYLSYSNEMKKYLQTAGKSIKLSLTSDLLLAKEYAYSNQVKVMLKLANDGTIKESKIAKSSGSKEIDDIVLRTVKETLNVVKPPQGEVPTPTFNLGLIITF